MKTRKEIKTDGNFGGNYSYEISYDSLPERFIEIDETQAWEIDQNPDKFRYIEDKVVDISNTEEYIEKVAAQEKENKISSLKLEIEELDRKRVRALAEPELKDQQSGETWLEYYTKQIQTIRTKIPLI